MPDQTRTELYLGHHYAAYVAGSAGEQDAVIKSFQGRVAADKDLKAEAEAKLASYVKAITDRDHVSRVHKDFLKKVLTNG